MTIYKGKKSRSISTCSLVCLSTDSSLTRAGKTTSAKQVYTLSALLFAQMILAMSFLCLEVQGSSDSSNPPQRTATVESLVNIPVDLVIKESLVVSPDSRRVAFVVRMGDGQAAVIDGQKGPRYDAIRELTFGPNSQHVSYIAKHRQEEVLLLDGIEDSHRWDHILPFTFSPDGKHMMYFAQHQPEEQTMQTSQRAYVVQAGDLLGMIAHHFYGDAKKWDILYNANKKKIGPDPRQLRVGIELVIPPLPEAVVVLDGEVQSTYPAIGARSIVFSPDSSRYAYVAIRNNRPFAVIDGTPGPSYDAVGGIVFSDEGKSYAYVARDGEKVFIILDGEKRGPYDEILEEQPCGFRPDSLEIAYGAKKSDKWHMVLGTQEGPGYDNISPFLFSHNGQHFAYVAQIGGTGELQIIDGKLVVVGTEKARQCIVIDGKEGPTYDGLEGMSFSSDGKHFAYVASKAKEGFFVVLDGKERGPYTKIGTQGPVLSPDGSRCAYAAEAGEDKVCVVEGKHKGKAYDDILALTFSPDGRWLAYAARDGDEWRLIINGTESQPYRDIVLIFWDSIVFDSPGRVHYLVMDNNVVSVVTEELR